jgi:hypothetical protein
MATRWQKSCIEALVAGPIAFKLFRLEQRNVKMMDQFCDKIWPYKYVEVLKPGILEQMGHETPGKKRKEYKSINIGIEIEYDGCSCQCLEKQLLANGAVSFDSGYDGGGTHNSDASPYNNRLRENRLRINGMKGLKSLYILLEWMKKNDCKIANSSGMHFHIDCTDVIPYSVDYWDMVNKLKRIDIGINTKINNSLEFSKIAISKIYKIEIDNMFLGNNIKQHIDFRTIEWRMATPILHYKTLVLQILVAIHVTECAKYKNKNLNDKYLWMLGEISNGTRNLPVKQY